MSHAASFKQDLERLRQVFERVNLSPLGCGALAGNVFGIDRDAIAAELGFSGITLNSMNTSGDRDFIIEFLTWNSMFTSHISRWAEDLILYSTSEFGFCRLSDLYSTGSRFVVSIATPRQSHKTLIHVQFNAEQEERRQFGTLARQVRPCFRSNGWADDGEFEYRHISS